MIINEHIDKSMQNYMHENACCICIQTCAHAYIYIYIHMHIDVTYNI